MLLSYIFYVVMYDLNNCNTILYLRDKIFIVVDFLNYNLVEITYIYNVLYNILETNINIWLE